MADNDTPLAVRTVRGPYLISEYTDMQETVNANRLDRLQGVFSQGSFYYNGSSNLIWSAEIRIYFHNDASDVIILNTIAASNIACADYNVFWVRRSQTDLQALTMQVSTYINFERATDLSNQSGDVVIIGYTETGVFYPAHAGLNKQDLRVNKVFLKDEASVYAGELTVSGPMTGNRTYTFPNVSSYIAPITDPLAAAEFGNLTKEELQQLININAETITNVQWGYLGALTESPQTHMSAANPHTDVVSHVAAANPHSGSEPSFSKNTGFNKNLGTSSGTVSEGDHSHAVVPEHRSWVANTAQFERVTMRGTPGAGDTYTQSLIAQTAADYALWGTAMGQDAGNHGAAGLTKEYINISGASNVYVAAAHMDLNTAAYPDSGICVAVYNSSKVLLEYICYIMNVHGSGTAPTYGTDMTSISIENVNGSWRSFSRDVKADLDTYASSWYYVRLGQFTNANSDGSATSSRLANINIYWA